MECIHKILLMSLLHKELILQTKLTALEVTAGVLAVDTENLCLGHSKCILKTFHDGIIY